MSVREEEVVEERDLVSAGWRSSEETAVKEEAVRETASVKEVEEEVMVEVGTRSS